MVRVLVLGFCIISASGCSNSKDFEDKLPTVSVGMTMADVEAILGKPDRILNTEEDTIGWFYEYEKVLHAIEFKDNIVSNKDKPAYKSLAELDEFILNQKMDEAIKTSALLKLACIKYKLDMGTFPDRLGYLITPNGDNSDKKWRGPYLSTADVPVDPWGNPFILNIEEATDTVIVTSMGPDGKRNTDDDISSNQ